MLCDVDATAISATSYTLFTSSSLDKYFKWYNCSFFCWRFKTPYFIGFFFFRFRFTTIKNILHAVADYFIVVLLRLYSNAFSTRNRALISWQCEQPKTEQRNGKIYIMVQHIFVAFCFCRIRFVLNKLRGIVEDFRRLNFISQAYFFLTVFFLLWWCSYLRAWNVVLHSFLISRKSEFRFLILSDFRFAKIE